MSVLDELQATVATQRRVLSALEPGCLNGPDALRLLEVITEGERVLAAGRTLVAKRVEESNVWRASGERSAAHFIAHKTGTSVGRTQAALETAERLAALPATAEAFRAGTLSEVPTRWRWRARRRRTERGATPTRTRRTRHGEAAARRVPAGAPRRDRRAGPLRRDPRRSPPAHLDRRRGRVLRCVPHHPRRGGEDAARLDAEIDRVFKGARAEGRREPHQAYAMDALETLVCGGGGGGTRSKPKAEIRVVVDYAALGTHRGGRGV